MENQGQRNSTKSVAESQANFTTSGRNTQKQETHSEEGDYGHTRESIDKILIPAIKRRFTDVLEGASFFPARIEKIKTRRDYIRLIASMPFILPAPSPENGMELTTAAAQNRLKRDFVRHLKNSAFTKRFSNLFFTELAHFLLARWNISKYHENIQKQLRKLPQVELSGRPSHPIGKIVAK